MPEVNTDLERRFWFFNAIVSLAALLFLSWLIFGHEPAPGQNLDLRFLPGVNAAFNAVAATLLVIGVAFVRRGRADIHRFFMIGAFAASVLFFAGYVLYHYAHGDTRYVGPARGLYLVLLSSHVLLSIFVMPMSMGCLYLALTDRIDRHRRLARITFPIWLYVSVTGVLIYVLLYPLGYGRLAV